MRDIVFLFGAGGSYGAGGILPERQLMRDLAIYFIQFRPYEKTSLYSRLVDDLVLAGKIDRTVFATLNYDCVLEFALASLGIQLAYFSDRSSPTCPVWKLHGSSNFFSAEVHASQDVLYGTGVVFEGGVQAFPDIGEVISHCLVGTGLAPVMSLYMEGKPLGVSPSVVKQIQAFWKDGVGKASAIFLIGVHPNVADDHVWMPLENTAASIGAIGDQAALATWAGSHRVTGTLESLGSTFVEGYPKLSERLAAA